MDGCSSFHSCTSITLACLLVSPLKSRGFGWAMRRRWILASFSPRVCSSRSSAYSRFLPSMPLLSRALESETKGPLGSWRARQRRQSTCFLEGGWTTLSRPPACEPACSTRLQLVSRMVMAHPVRLLSTASASPGCCANHLGSTLATQDWLPQVLQGEYRRFDNARLSRSNMSVLGGAVRAPSAGSNTNAQAFFLVSPW